MNDIRSWTTKAKRKDNNKWVDGQIWVGADTSVIIPTGTGIAYDETGTVHAGVVEVLTDTISYSTETFRYGQILFTNDIVMINNNIPSVAIFYDGAFGIITMGENEFTDEITMCPAVSKLPTAIAKLVPNELAPTIRFVSLETLDKLTFIESTRIVGNIFDNPDIIKNYAEDQKEQIMPASLQKYRNTPNLQRLLRDTNEDTSVVKEILQLMIEIKRRTLLASYFDSGCKDLHLHDCVDTDIWHLWDDLLPMRENITSAMMFKMALSTLKRATDSVLVTHFLTNYAIICKECAAFDKTMSSFIDIDDATADDICLAMKNESSFINIDVMIRQENPSGITSLLDWLFMAKKPIRDLRAKDNAYVCYIDALNNRGITFDNIDALKTFSSTIVEENRTCVHYTNESESAC